MFRLPRWLLPTLLLACLLPAWTHAEGDGDDALTLYYRAAITIEPDGTLSGLSWQRAEKIPAVVRERLEARIRTWQFAPGTMDGQPARTNSFLQLRLRAEPRADGYVLRVENAQTGAATAPMLPPKYPHYALLDGEEAGVRAKLTVDPDGNRQVTITMLASSEVHPEHVNGHPVPAAFSFPVTFCMTDSGGEEDCDHPEWPDRKTVSEGPATTAPGSPVPIGSVARLLTDVRGAAI